MTSQAQLSSIAPGQVLSGRFEVSGLAVSDGFGQVLAATDRKMGKPVSLRFVRGAAVLSGVRQQLKVIGTAHHANVVPGFGVLPLGAEDALLVQGPLTGRQLSEHVKQRVAGGGLVSLRGAYNVVAHVANALTFAHATGPHGAVRPGSVWLSDDGRVQLADLVLSRALLGQPGQLGGLPEADVAYLAPEIKAGHAPMPASDIFGLGALLYVLLTNRSPTDEFAPPSQVHPEATSALDGQLFRALSPDPSQRHASPDAFRLELLQLMGNSAEGTANDFGQDIEIEVNLASISPRASSSRPPVSVEVPKAPRMPSGTHQPVGANGGARASGTHQPVAGTRASSGNHPPVGERASSVPQVGSRVSLNEDFRVSIAVDEGEADAARRRQSLGEVDLKDVLAKITEDDSPRWMVVKNGMDHGPFTGRQLVNMIVQGEALRDHELLNTDSGQRGKIGQFPEFEEFLKQFEMRKNEAARAQALASTETAEKHSARFKVFMGIAIVGAIALAGGFYAITRNRAEGGRADADLDLYKRGQAEMSGSAGILPAPRPGTRRSGGGGGGGGGGMSYEDAMMQAVNIGSAEGGGEQTLSPGTVAGVMNRNLNSIYNACVHGSVGTVKIDMAIAGNGSVLGVSVDGGDGGLQRCVADQVRRVHFPSFSAPRMGARFTFGT